jgi:effector-binding domain-containing protein
MQFGKIIAPKIVAPFGPSLRLATLFAALSIPLTGFAALAQQAAPTVAPAPAQPASAAKDAPAPVPAPAAPTPAPGAPAAPAPAPNPPAVPAPAGQEDVSIKTIELAARPVLTQHGSSNWEDGYKVIGDSLAKLRAAADKNKMKVSGRPIAVFVETDDGGFKYDAMLPVDAPADAKFDLGADIALGQSPAGKAIKFQHRGAYDDIDSTYEAITAYLDEKGLEARNLFVEEYLNDGKDSSDMSLQVDIYVFLK